MDVDKFVSGLVGVSVLMWLVLHGKDFGTFLGGVAAGSTQLVNGIRGT